MALSPRLAPGTVVGERFVLEALAGTGGMGEVYRAKDTKTGDAAAVKVLHTDSAHAARFAREARALAQLEHPSIVRYVAHGDHPLVFLAMEWLDGEDLWHRLAKGPLGVRDTVDLARRVSGGLCLAHARGIVHRDIKPSNIFLPGRRIEAAKLLDFGIALMSQATRAHTVSGQVLGTLGYMAPEQASDGRDVTARVDVFSLGCVLFECLTGRPAFPGDRMMEVLAKILFSQAPRVSDLCDGVPSALDDIVARMMRKDPEERPTLAAVSAELEALSSVGALASSAAARRTASSATGPAVSEDERRLMAIVLADHVVDSGPVRSSSPTVSIENVRSIALSLGEAIAPLGARLEILSHGATLVVLTATEAATDLATRAARCSLVIRSVLPHARIAVALGRGDPSAEEHLGELVSRAEALLATDASPRSGGVTAVRVDPMTAGLLDTRFELGGDAAGLLLEGERERADPVRKLLGRARPCVGRERELSMLNAIADECFSEPIGQAVVVTAPAGIGKSRLVFELMRSLEARHPRLEPWFARGEPMAAGSSFALIGQIVRSIGGLVEGEANEVRRSKLRARLGRHLGEEAARRVADTLGEVAGVSPTDEPQPTLRGGQKDAALVGEHLRKAWDELVLAEAGKEPLVVVLEDAHLGDLPSLRFIDSALRGCRELPLLVLAVARPELAEKFPSLWSERRVVQLRLSELTPSASRRLVKDALGDGIDKARVDALVERAGGNAFYLEELIRTVAEGNEDLPATVIAMAQARLERLDADARRVLRAASIFGPAFWTDGVAALLGAQDRAADVAAALAELEKREVISKQISSRFRDEEEHTFRQMLVRDAAYGMLTLRDRRLGHKSAAEWLEARGERDAMVLAEHLERGAEPHRAIVWYLWAAEQAFEGNDLASVVDRAQRGIACGATGAVLGELRLLQAEAIGWGKGGPDHAQFAKAALALLPVGSTAWCRAAAEVAGAAAAAGDRAALSAIAEELAAVRRDDSIGAAHAVAMGRTAAELLEAGLAREAGALVTWIEATTPFTHDHDRVTFEIVAGWLRAFGELIAGRPEAFILSGQRLAADFSAAGYARQSALVALQTSVAHGEIGQFVEAFEWAERALHTATELGLASICDRIEAHAVYLRARQVAPR